MINVDKCRAGGMLLVWREHFEGSVLIGSLDFTDPYSVEPVFKSFTPLCLTLEELKEITSAIEAGWPQEQQHGGN